MRRPKQLKVVLYLNGYQTVNLRSALDVGALHEGPTNPLSVLDSGDWLSEIREMLPAIDDGIHTHGPNRTPEEYRDAARARVGLDRPDEWLSDHDKERIGEILAGYGDWFSAELLRLINKADAINLWKLQQMYPEHVNAFLAWDRGEEVT